MSISSAAHRWLPGFLLCLTAAACAQAGPSIRYKRDLQGLFSSAAFDEAATHIERHQQNQYGKSNSVLFYLDRAVALHDAGRYTESDQALDLAERRMDELYTKSFSKAAGQFFVHDATQDYLGEPYERALLYVYRALNHLFLGQKDEAAVEARKVSFFLNELREKSEIELSYRDDAFAHLLSAMILDDVGEGDNARLSLGWAQQAYAAYAQTFQTPIPAKLLQGLLLRDPEAEANARMEAEASALRETAEVRSPDISSEVTQPPLTKDDGTASTDPSSSGDLVGNDAVIMRAEAAFSRLDGNPESESTSPLGESGVAETLDENQPVTDQILSEAPSTSAALDWATVPLSLPSATPSSSPSPQHAKDEGELVLFHYNGLIPHKVETRFQIAGNEAVIYVNQYPGEVEGERVNEAGIAAISQNSIVVALPKMEQTPFQVQSSWVQCLDGSCQVETTLVENIDAIAHRTMQERLDAIRARSIARAAIKFAITHAAAITTDVAMRQSEQTAGYAALAGALVSIIGSAASSATEQADTRGWLTAPAQIRMARLRLPAGSHDLRVVFVTANGTPLTSLDLPATPVVAGQRTYRHLRTSF